MRVGFCIVFFQTTKLRIRLRALYRIPTQSLPYNYLYYWERERTPAGVLLFEIQQSKKFFKRNLLVYQSATSQFLEAHLRFFIRYYSHGNRYGRICDRHVRNHRI